MTLDDLAKTHYLAIIPERHMNAPNRNQLFPPVSFARAESLPVSDRVLDRLADLMLDANDVLDLLRREEAMTIQWIRPHVQRVFDDVNDVMKRLSH
ncbi:MAG: hypothetical protein ACXW5U_29155 [Thermoanaerobaculia bacterium]